MSDFSFSYEKKNNVYIIHASLQKPRFEIRITTDKAGWYPTSITSTEMDNWHPQKRRINRCLIQYALFKIFELLMTKVTRFQTSIGR